MLLSVVAIIYMGIKLTENEYSTDRRGVSDIGRSVGKAFAMKAISNSPWIGYGSWSRNREFHQMHEQALNEVAGKEANRFNTDNASSATHAMLLQAWVEGGILAITFFVVLGIYLLRDLHWLMLRRPMDALSPILAYFALYGLWHIIMSAFAAPLRLHLALAAVCIVLVALESMHARDLRVRSKIRDAGTGRAP
jgi:O-antigen ligase